MMTKSLDIKLLGKDYRVACRPDERESLLASAHYLDGKLGEAERKTQGSVERVAIMAALNITHELLLARTPQPTSGVTPDAGNSSGNTMTATLETESIQRRIKSIETRLDATLDRYPDTM